MGQNRLFYACQAVGLGDYNSAKYVEGVQTVGVDTTVDFEQAFELGVITLYDNMEGTPSVELTLERNLVSGVFPLWTSMATLAGEKATTAFTVNAHEQVVAIGSARPTAVLQVYKETTSYAGKNDTSSTPTFHIQLSGLYVTNYSVTIGIDGSPTESMSFVGNDYKWYENGTTKITNAPPDGASVASSGVIFRKQDVRPSGYSAIVPSNGYISGSGLQSVSFSLDFGREDIFELGKKAPYFKAPTFPVEVTAELEFIDTATQESKYIKPYGVNENNGLGFKESSNQDVTSGVPLAIALQDMIFYMGSGRLTGSSRSGGDAGGGNATVSYSFQNFNYFHATGITNGYKHYNKLGSTSSAQ